MEAKELLKRARIQIQSKNSFFAYLSLYLKFKESKDLPDYAGAGVNIRGDFFYKKEFIEKMGKENSTKEIEGVIVHEILHLSLLHLLRIGKRDCKIWNISADIVVNQLLKDNNFSLPDKCIMSNSDNVIEIGGIKIEDCNKKTSEQIYSELEKQAKKVKQQLGQDGGGEGMRFDEHFEGEDGNSKKGEKGKGKSLSAGEMKEIEKMWSDRTQEALTISKMKGDTPSGIGRLVGELHKEKINWKALLNQYITQQIPYNQCYCLDKNTFIKTPIGDIKIKNLKIGQIIYGIKNGKIIKNRIKQTLRRNIKEKFIIYTKSGKRLICSGEHQILTTEKFIKAKNLKIGDIISTTE